MLCEVQAPKSLRARYANPSLERGETPETEAQSNPSNVSEHVVQYPV